MSQPTCSPCVVQNAHITKTFMELKLYAIISELLDHWHKCEMKAQMMVSLVENIPSWKVIIIPILFLHFGMA